MSTNINGKQMFVERMKHRQNLKNSDSTCLQTITTAKFTILKNDKILITRNSEDVMNIHWLTFKELSDITALELNEIVDNSVILNSPTEETSTLFGYNVCHNDDLFENKLHSKFVNLRKTLFFLSPIQSKLAMQAYAIIKWHLEHQFCSRCGKKSSTNISGSFRQCQNCKHISYPQMVPAAIVLVNNPKTHDCLLVRQPAYPKGMYTCISGFGEVGETLEETIEREVAEEVGLEVSDIRYVASQHWSYPLSSLMLACFATVKEKHSEIIIDHTELEDARWFSLDAVKEAFKNSLKITNISQILTNADDQIYVPIKGAIAHELVKKWILQQNKCKFV